jgi:hypothetical protein
MPTAGSRGTRMDAPRKLWIWTGSGIARRGADGARAGAAAHLDGRLDGEAAGQRGAGHGGHDRGVRNECAVDVMKSSPRRAKPGATLAVRIFGPGAPSLQIHRDHRSSSASFTAKLTGGRNMNRRVRTRYGVIDGLILSHDGRFVVSVAVSEQSSFRGTVLRLFAHTNHLIGTNLVSEFFHRGALKAPEIGFER